MTSDQQTLVYNDHYFKSHYCNIKSKMSVPVSYLNSLGKLSIFFMQYEIKYVSCITDYKCDGEASLEIWNIWHFLQGIWSKHPH